jgi:hypothetical protein
LSEATRVCRNFAQRFKQQYKDGFFSPKPFTDWNNGIVGGEVKWYELKKEISSHTASLSLSSAAATWP